MYRIRIRRHEEVQKTLNLILLCGFVIHLEVLHAPLKILTDLHLSHILCNPLMHRTIDLTNQASFLCFLNTQVLNDLGRHHAKDFFYQIFVDQGLCSAKFQTKG